MITTTVLLSQELKKNESVYKTFVKIIRKSRTVQENHDDLNLHVALYVMYETENLRIYGFQNLEIYFGFKRSNFEHCSTHH